MGFAIYLSVLLLLIVAVTLAFNVYWPVRDDMSYLGGVLYTLAVVAVSLCVPRIFRFFLVRGWVADWSDWRHRFAFGASNDWTRIDVRGWDIDGIRLQCRRDKTKGTFEGCASLLGLHLHLAILVDKTEQEQYQKLVQAKREEMIARMPPHMREAMSTMMADLPPDAELKETGIIAVPRPFPDDDDDDDPPQGGSGGVH